MALWHPALRVIYFWEVEEQTSGSMIGVMETYWGRWRGIICMNIILSVIRYQIYHTPHLRHMSYVIKPCTSDARHTSFPSWSSPEAESSYSWRGNFTTGNDWLSCSQWTWNRTANKRKKKSGSWERIKFFCFQSGGGGSRDQVRHTRRSAEIFTLNFIQALPREKSTSR